MRSGPRYTAETNPTPDPNVRMTWRTDAIRPRMGPEPDCQPRVVAMRMRTGGTGMERVSQAALIATGVVAFFFALDAVEVILAPLALALVTGVVMSPISDFCDRLGFPPVIGALSNLLLTLILAGALVLLFQPVVTQLVEQAPKVWSDMQEMIAALRGLHEVSKDVSQAIVPAAQADAPAADEGKDIVPTVTDAVMLAPAIAAQILTFAGGLFFFVLTRTEVYDWVALQLSDMSNRAATAARLRDAERSVSRYFLTISLINAAVGVATAAALQVMAVPGAVLWGMIAFIVNFVIYLGPAVFAAALLFAGVAAFDGAMALLPAAAFVAINFVESQFATPALIGRHLELNPLLVFCALLFGVWLWGTIGGIVAIPVLLWIRVLNTAAAIPARDVTA